MKTSKLNTKVSIKLISITISIVFLFFILPSTIYAKKLDGYHKEYTLKHYTDENGLPQISVKRIAADKQGFLWLATESGLVRFDGLHFYTFDKSNSAISKQRFIFFQPDLSGNQQRFYASAEQDVLRIENGTAIEDPVYTKEKLNRVPYLSPGEYNSFLAVGAPNNYFGILGPTGSNYTVLNASGVGSFYLIGTTSTVFYKNWKRVWTLPIQNGNYKNYFGYKGGLYHLSDHGTIKKFRPEGVSEKAITGALQKETALESGKIKATLYWNNVSDQVCLLVGKRFYLLDVGNNGDWTSRLILDGFDFEKNNVKTFHYDAPTQRLFLGSFTRGLFVFSKKLFHSVKISEKDDDNILYALTLSNNGEVITPKGYVFRPLPAGIKLQKVFALMKAKHVGDHRAILVDRQGNIWVKSFFKLYKFDSSGTKILGEWTMPNEIKTLYEGMEGKIWIGLNSGELYHISPREEQPTALLGTSIPQIAYLLQTKPNLLWAASSDGLYLVNTRSGETKLIPGTQKKMVTSLHVSPLQPDGIFFSTYENGLFYYNQGKVVHFPLDENRNLSVAHCMIEDKSGFLWIPTNKGLFRFAMQDLIRFARRSTKVDMLNERVFFNYYTKESGFHTNEFNGGCQPCGLNLPDGRIILPSLNGLVWFDPDRITTEVPSNVFIMDRYEANGMANRMRDSVIFLDNDPRQINFHISMPFFGHEISRNIEYNISRKGQDLQKELWIPIRSADPVIRLSSLRSGWHILTVRKLNGFGSNNYFTRQIKINVSPRWYETAVFWSLCAFILIGLFVGYFRLRIQYLLRVNVRLESVVNERTNELQHMITALRTSEQELSKQFHIQSRLVASISHDVHTPLKFALSVSRKIQTLVSNGEYKEVERMNDGLATTLEGMYNLLLNLTTYVKNQIYQDQHQLQRVKLSDIVSVKIELFQGAIKDNRNMVYTQVPDELMVWSDPNLLAILIHNLIDNANKYSSNGTIQILARVLGNELHLIIKDEGPGLPKSLSDWLNTAASEHEFEVLQDLSTQYQGLGLIIIKEISSFLDIRILVEVHSGTSFHLIFNCDTQLASDC